MRSAARGLQHCITFTRLMVAHSHHMAIHATRSCQQYRYATRAPLLISIHPVQGATPQSHVDINGASAERRSDAEDAAGPSKSHVAANPHLLCWPHSRLATVSLVRSQRQYTSDYTALCSMHHTVAPANTANPKTLISAGRVAGVIGG